MLWPSRFECLHVFTLRCILVTVCFIILYYIIFYFGLSLLLRIYSDMLQRDPSTLPKDIGVYDSGFPCQPFSLLHHNSNFFQEEQAELFRETLKTVYRIKPLVCVLENVVGILRVWETVEKHLAKLNDHYVYCHLIINPLKLGDPVNRRRVYILMINRPLAITAVCCFW